MTGASAVSGPQVMIVGAGHNGLVAAVQLARAGCQVTVLEQGSEPGGCVWTETHESGVIVERGAFEHGGVYALAQQLGLDDPVLGDRAITYREHPVIAGFVFGDGERRVFYTDVERTINSLSEDAAAYRGLVDLASVLFGMLSTFDSPPTLTQIASTLSPLRGGDDLFRIMMQSAETVLEGRLSDQYLKAALALQASHAQVPAWSPGTGIFSLLLPSSHDGPAVRPEGGSRTLIDALVAALEQAGGRVITNANVVRISSDKTTHQTRSEAPSRTPESSSPAKRTAARVGVFGGGFGSSQAVPSTQEQFDWSQGGEVELDNGTILRCDAVVSTLGIERTARLLTDPAPKLREAAVGLHSGHFNVSELTVTVVTDQPVALPFEDPQAVWYAVNDPADVRTGFGEVLAGKLPSSPWSMVAQVGQPEHIQGSAIWMSSIVPLTRADGPWTPLLERAAAFRVIDQVSSVLRVDLREHLIDAIVSGPSTWSRRIGGDGNPNHLDNTIDQLMGWRAPGHSNMRTELPWLFLSGAGQHPGGGLSGASGSAVAAAVLSGHGSEDGFAHRALQEVRGLRNGLKAYRSMRKGTL